MKAKIQKTLSILLPLALGVFLIYYTFRGYSQAQFDLIRSNFAQADYTYILLSLLLSLLGVASRAYRWKYSLEYMGYPTKFSTNFFAVSVGYLMNTTIPRSGEISRAVVLKKYSDVPFDKGFGSIIAERIVDTLILLLMCLFALLVQFDVVKSFVLDKIPMQQLFTLGAIALVVALVFAWLYFYSSWVFILKVKAKLSGLKEGLLSIWKMPTKYAFLGHTLFIWVSYVAMFWITIYALDGTSHLGMGAVLSSFIVGSMAVAVTSSGFGTYPVLVAQILVLYGVDLEVGVAFGWIVWTSQFLLVVSTGFISLVLLPIFNRK